MFRPEGYPLRPARGRMLLELAADGSFTALAPGPVDAPVPTDALSGWMVESIEPDRVILRRGPRPHASP